MRVHTWSVIAVLGTSIVLAGCGDRGMMTSSTRMGSGAGDAVFMSVSPQGGATGVATTTGITLRFGSSMATGMEQFLDLHLGDLSGPVVPMSCGWSGDRTTITCTPQAGLQPRATYAVHLGGGMTSLAGRPLNYNSYGPLMGGQWITGGMMGASHAGSQWGMMGSGGQNGNSSYGMVFTFTTA